MTSTTAASGLADHRSPAIAPAAVPDDDPISVAVPFTPLNVLIAVPTLHAGAADAGAVELVRILASGGHRVFVASGGGRLAAPSARASRIPSIRLLPLP